MINGIKNAGLSSSYPVSPANGRNSFARELEEVFEKKEDKKKEIDNKKKATGDKKNETDKSRRDSYEKSQDTSESGTSSDIIVKPDGSRILMLTVKAGGTETTMSFEISKPTELPNGKMTGNLEEEQMAADRSPMSAVNETETAEIRTV